jgi:hypothetical protein
VSAALAVVTPVLYRGQSVLVVLIGCVQRKTEWSQTQNLIKKVIY